MSNAPMSTPGDRARVAALWNAPFLNDSYFWSLDAVRRHINERISGDPGCDWIDWFSRHHLAATLPLARCLSLCCGQGHLERRLVRGGVAAACDGIDLSDRSIAEAQRLAAEAGLDSLRYVCADVNHVELEPVAYDAVFVQSGLHHVARLEHVYEQVRRALKPGGWFVMNEYVGPSRFQFTDRQLEAMNAALRLLPAQYRQSIRQPRVMAGPQTPGRDMPTSASATVARIVAKARSRTLWPAVHRRLNTAVRRRRNQPLLKERIDRPTVAAMKLWDPSEAVRSADIVPLLPAFFQVVDTRYWGGTLLNFLLDDIAGNFGGSEVDHRLLHMLFCIEDTLLDTGDLASDFAVIVARRGRASGHQGGQLRGDEC